MDRLLRSGHADENVLIALGVDLMAQHVFLLPLTFPDNLSAVSYDDLEAYLQLFLRKAKRRAGGAAAN